MRAIRRCPVRGRASFSRNDVEQMIEPIQSRRNVRMSCQLASENRRELFFKLIKEQNAGSSLEQSRKRMSEEFKIAVSEVITIEQQGRFNQWPPLA